MTQPIYHTPLNISYLYLYYSIIFLWTLSHLWLFKVLRINVSDCHCQCISFNVASDLVFYRSKEWRIYSKDHTVSILYLLWRDETVHFLESFSELSFVFQTISPRDIGKKIKTRGDEIVFTSLPSIWQKLFGFPLFRLLLKQKWAVFGVSRISRYLHITILLPQVSLQSADNAKGYTHDKVWKL